MAEENTGVPKENKEEENEAVPEVEQEFSGGAEKGSTLPLVASAGTAGEEKKEELDDDNKKIVTYLDREIPLDENNYKKLITEDRLVIPLLEKHGIKASGQKQSGVATKTAAPNKGAAPKKELTWAERQAAKNKK